MLPDNDNVTSLPKRGPYRPERINSNAPAMPPAAEPAELGPMDDEDLETKTSY